METIESVEKFASGVMNTSIIVILLSLGGFSLLMKFNLSNLGHDDRTGAVLGKMIFLFESFHIILLILALIGVLSLIGGFKLKALKPWSILMLNFSALLLILLILGYAVCWFKLAMNYDRLLNGLADLFYVLILSYWFVLVLKFIVRVNKIDIKELIAEQA